MASYPRLIRCIIFTFVSQNLVKMWSKGLSMVRKYFIAGTDTEVGKTYTTVALMRTLKAQGHHVLGIKAVAAGCTLTRVGVRNEDAVAIENAASSSLPYELINPITLTQAVAPHIAAQLDGKRLSASRISGYIRGAMTHKTDYLFVEGAGGWRVPLNQMEYLSCVVKELQFRVILVVGMRLGCINHALLTAEAMMHDGVTLVGWIANCLDASMPVLEENIATLEAQLPCPRIATIPFNADQNIEFDHQI